eukprot:1596989-Rhodomonas_salina.2
MTPYARSVPDMAYGRVGRQGRGTAGGTAHSVPHTGWQHTPAQYRTPRSTSVCGQYHAEQHTLAQYHLSRRSLCHAHTWLDNAGDVVENLLRAGSSIARLSTRHCVAHA